MCMESFSWHLSRVQLFLVQSIAEICTPRLHFAIELQVCSGNYFLSCSLSGSPCREAFSSGASHPISGAEASGWEMWLSFWKHLVAFIPF